MPSKRSATKPHTQNTVGRVRASARPALCVIAALSLAACEDTGGEAPGAVSAGEAAELDAIAEELDARQLPAEAVPDLQESSEGLQEVSGDE